jgi:hypothetical protein
MAASDTDMDMDTSDGGSTDACVNYATQVESMGCAELDAFADAEFCQAVAVECPSTLALVECLLEAGPCSADVDTQCEMQGAAWELECLGDGDGDGDGDGGGSPECQMTNAVGEILCDPGCTCPVGLVCPVGGGTCDPE